MAGATSRQHMVVPPSGVMHRNWNGCDFLPRMAINHKGCNGIWHKCQIHRRNGRQTHRSAIGFFLQGHLWLFEFNPTKDNDSQLGVTGKSVLRSNRAIRIAVTPYNVTIFTYYLHDHDLTIRVKCTRRVTMTMR